MKNIRTKLVESLFYIACIGIFVLTVLSVVSLYNISTESMSLAEQYVQELNN